MANKEIVIRGARVNNLKNIDLSIPRNQMVVFTGLSGSGKSSLAFDTLYAEGHRRFVESLSSYARQFLGQLDKPDVDSIEGLSPAISIDQKTTSHNPRSTVGTVTEIYDYLRLLYARVGVPHCPVCGKEIKMQPTDQIIDKILTLPEGTRFALLAPVVRGKKGMHEKVFEEAKRSGFLRVRVDGSLYELEEEIKLDKNVKHTIEVVIDRLIMREDIRTRLADSVETALRKGSGNLLVVTLPREGEGEATEFAFSQNYACEEHGFSIGELSPNQFSFNNPFGACEHCAGLGVIRSVSRERLIPDRNKSLREGAIVCNGFKTVDEMSWTGPLLAAVGKKYGFTLDTPIKDFSEEAINVLFDGCPGQFDVVRYFGKMPHRQFVAFDGLIATVRRRMTQGSEEYYEEFTENTPCPVCHGKRLKKEMLAVTVGGLNIDEVTQLPVSKAKSFFSALSLSPNEAIIAKEILKEVISRLSFLESVGLDYLTLARSAGTLSGGEAQRIRLATQIGSSLTGVMYILDEPSIGLHQRDNGKLIQTLKRLRDLGNTLIVVEHDEETMTESDYIVDIGPGAGIHGGNVVACGSPEEVAANRDSITGDYLSGRRKIGIPSERRTGNGRTVTVKKAAQNNLKGIDVSFPLGKFICVTGVSGSGKSSLVNGILYPALAHELQGAFALPGKHEAVTGIENLDKVICIDQSPIGRTPRSNPATYTGVFGEIRDLFAKTPDARIRGYGPGRFSFNVRGGRCEACEGDGVKKIEMHFLPDVYITCDVCGGKRYNHDTLEVRYKNKNIFEVLDMTIEEALSFFSAIPSIKRKIQALNDVGLGYVKLGQSSTTLSGGEAQRVKLATELAKRATGRTMYILDEPTTGLHSHDVKKLIEMLQRLVDAGNTVLVIEHNLDVIKCADHLIDLGPEGGDRGGKIIACGTPEEVARVDSSYTGQYLRKIFEKENRKI